MTELKELGLQTLKLNINDSIVEPIFAKEGDKKSRGLNIQLLKNNQEFDTTGITMKMRARPKDKEVYEMNVSEIDMTKGMYQIIYPSVILQEGIVYAELILYKDDAIISSKKFIIEVEGGLVTDSAIEGHNVYPLFERLLKAAGKIDDLSEEQRIKNEGLRETNEVIRIDNESLRQLQEQQRQESMSDIENRFTNLTTEQQQDAEVINARTSTIKNKTFDSLKDRLEEAEKDINKAEQNAKQYTNTEIEKINNKIDKPLYSTPVETYDNVISLPDNNINGPINVNIKGNTLTNCAGLSGRGFNSPEDDILINQGTIEDGVLELSGRDTLFSNFRIRVNWKPNTKYTVVVNVLENTLVSKCTLVREREIDAAEQTIPFGFTGRYVSSFLTGNNVEDTSLTYIRPGETSDNKIKLKNLMILEGDYTSKEINYIKGTKSVPASFRVKSVGKNLFDGDKVSPYLQESNVSWNGEKLTFKRTNGNYYSGGIIRLNVNVGNQYTFNSTFLEGDSTYSVRIYDEHFNTIAIGTTSFTFVPTTNIIYILFTSSSAIHSGTTLANIHVNYDENTEYEPYKESIAYITAKDKDNKIVNLNRVGDVSDEIDLDKGELIKATSNWTVLDENNDWSFKDNQVGFKRVEIRNYLDVIKYPKGTPVIAFTNNTRFINQSTVLAPNCIEIWNGSLYVSLSNTDTGWGEDYAPTVQEIKNYIANNPITLIYQLAEPETIPIEIEGELQGYENGTVYFTPYIKDKFIVDNTKLIKLQYPIKAIDKLLKLDTANAKWIEVEGVLSEDGQTITVNEEGTYKVYGEIQEGYSTNGLKRIVTNINLNAQINSNTTAIEKINNKIYADADLFTAMLLQQEVRITALEQGRVI